MQRIETASDIEAGIAALCRLDPLMAAIAPDCRPVPLRRRPASFATLAEIIVAQVISRGAADRIMQRLVDTCGGCLSAETCPPVETLRALGLSLPKAQSISIAAAAARTGRLSLAALADMPEQEALTQLTALPGIGRWTAEVFLLTGLGAADVFPAGDLALRQAYGRASAGPVPTERELRAISHRWSPHRSVAARLLWAFHALAR